MATYFKTMEVEIDVLKDLNLKTVFIAFTHQKKSHSGQEILLNLKITIKAPDCLKAWINLLSTLKEPGLAIEDHNWAANKLKDETIQLNILNKHFYNTITIKKNLELPHMFLLGQKFNHKIVTKYTLFPYKTLPRVAIMMIHVNK